MSLATATVLGSAPFRFRPVTDWGRLPAGMSYGEAVGLACDSQDRVYVFNRGPQPVIVLDRDGRFLHAWGENVFRRPHGIHVGPDDALYLTDDWDHTVRKFSAEGQVLLTLGKSGQPSDTGIQGMDHRGIRGAGPFNMPTNAALSAAGDIYVSDGYGNCRIHCFSPKGVLRHSWGEAGDGPGQFNLPHGIAVDAQGRVYVADRENSRVQVFAADGKVLDQWTDLWRPCEVFVDRDQRVFVAEIGRAVGAFPWQTPNTAQHSRVSVFDPQGKLLARFGGQRPGQPGDFLAVHDLWIDSQGSLYTAEVILSAAGKHELRRPDTPTVQKFERVE